MASRLRITGFARFFLFMLIAAPIIYLATAYFRGEDGLQNVKNLVNNTPTEEATTVPLDCDDLRAENARLRQELTRLRTQVD